jgi:hypothetical protein
MHHNPALEHFPNEAAIIGRMVVGFGELEYMACSLAAKCMPEYEATLRVFYSLRATSARIDSADMLMRAKYAAKGFQAQQETALKAVSLCLRIRNQYAHCMWGDHHEGGLFFADLQDSAKRMSWHPDWKHVGVPLLEKQEKFFGYTRLWLFYLEQVIPEVSQYQPFPEPPAQSPPPLHNPEGTHIPPWLSEGQKALHILHAQEAEARASQPVRQPSVLRLTREEWAAKDAKDARESAATDLN